MNFFGKIGGWILWILIGVWVTAQCRLKKFFCIIHGINYRSFQRVVLISLIGADMTRSYWHKWFLPYLRNILFLTIWCVFHLFGGKIFIFTLYILAILSSESYCDATFNNNLGRKYIKDFCNHLVTIETFIYY